MLDEIQPRDVKVPEHIKDHPGDNAPANQGLQHNASNQRIEAQPDLHPHQLANGRQVSILDLFALFIAIVKVQFWGSYESATFLYQALENGNGSIKRNTESREG